LVLGPTVITPNAGRWLSGPSPPGPDAAFLIPGLPLIGILFVTQVVNAVLLLPLLLAMILLGRDPIVLGRYRNRRLGTALACAASALVAASLVALALSAAA
jgi:Mn2+/Fe2+ NRAMP family transporter